MVFLKSLHIHAVSIGLVYVAELKQVLSPLSCLPLCLELSGDFHVAPVNHPVIADKLGPELRQEEQLFCRVTKHNPPTCNTGDTRPILLDSLSHFFHSDCKI